MSANQGVLRSAVPRLVVAGVASGVGKTTVAVGLMAALRRRGRAVQPFKVGPDYIDPGHHRQAAGRASRNLDTWLTPPATMRELYARAVVGADIAIVEGVMGLFDGRSGQGEVGSTAHVARLLGAPTLLVVDVAKSARSAAAVVLGCQHFDPALCLAGVVLNHVASPAHLEAAREAIETATGLPVLGHLPRRPDLAVPERHLGLVPAVERADEAELIGRLAAEVEARFDLARIEHVAAQAEPLVVEPSRLWPAQPREGPPRARLGLALDEAFNFYYEEGLDLLRAWGMEIVPFSPLRDTALPEGIDGVYLGGGFPEIFAADLAANTPMQAALRQADRAGMPIYAECGGLMYLSEAIVDSQGATHAMVGLVPGRSRMRSRRVALGYREVRARADSPLLTAGTTARGHEFHWSELEAPPPAEHAAYEVVEPTPGHEGYLRGNLLASYVHLQPASSASLAPRFVAACAAWRAAASPPATPREEGAGTASLSSGGRGSG